MGQRLVDKNVARYVTESGEQGLVVDPLIAQALHHPHPGALRGHPDAGMLAAHGSGVRRRIAGSAASVFQRCRGWPRQSAEPGSHKIHLRILGQIDLQRRNGHEALCDRVKVRAIARVLGVAGSADPVDQFTARISGFDHRFGLVAAPKSSHLESSEFIVRDVRDIHIEQHRRPQRLLLGSASPNLPPLEQP